MYFILTLLRVTVISVPTNKCIQKLLRKEKPRKKKMILYCEWKHGQLVEKVGVGSIRR